MRIDEPGHQCTSLAFHDRRARRRDGGCANGDDAIAADENRCDCSQAIRLAVKYANVTKQSFAWGLCGGSANYKNGRKPA